MKTLSRSFYLLLAAAFIMASSFGFAKSGERSVATYELNPAVSLYADMLPQPVGGYEALANKVDYPELALNANIEGNILAKVSIGDNGDVEKVELLKKVGGGCDEAVVKAIKDTKFTYNVSAGMPKLNEISILFRFERHNYK